MKHPVRFDRFVRDIIEHTPIVKMVALLVVLWLAASLGMYWAERGQPGGHLAAFPDALYWSVAAFSTAGIADTPVTGAGKLIGGLWIVVGSTLFFGTIVATLTAYFMRPLQRPAKQIIEVVEYNLEQINYLSTEELALLKDTVNTLIVHMEHVQRKREENSAKP